ncbi:MAG: MFS transporter [candidate division Zixibacteria bacterium]|nr:MFS transporter [candidate division Zixibacteria bacterium]
MPDNPTGLKFIARALYSRNYRLFFAGQGVSLIGTWMQRIALGWLVYRLTHSAFLLGMVGFAGQIPILLLSPIAGVLADRWNRRRLIIVTQILSMLQAFVLTFLILSHTIAIWHIIFLSIFLGIVNSFDTPVRQAFVVEMIEKKEDLGNAIALNSSIFNGARLLGPSIAGILIAAVGEGICFLFNGISYIAVIFALIAMRIKPQKKPAREAHILHGLKEGFMHSFGFAPIRSILLLLGLVSLVGMPYTVLMPIFAKDILHGGPRTLGFLMGAAGVGALVGALYLASRKSPKGLEKIIALSTTIFGVGLIVFSSSRQIWLSLPLMSLTGFGMMVQMASSNTILQTIADDDKRGRVMSFYTMSFLGTAPFGSLLAGGLAGKIGTPQTLLLGGIFCILGAFLFTRQLSTLRETIGQAYTKKDAVLEVRRGIQGATELTTPPKD